MTDALSASLQSDSKLSQLYVLDLLPSFHFGCRQKRRDPSVGPQMSEKRHLGGIFGLVRHDTSNPDRKEWDFE